MALDDKNQPDSSTSILSNGISSALARYGLYIFKDCDIDIELILKEIKDSFC